MKVRIFLPMVAICALLVVACSKTEVTTNREATAPVASNATTPAQPTAVLTTAEKIGVPECDNFLAAYDACVSGKVPEAARAQYKASIEQWRTSWKKLADNPATKASLAAACKQSAEQAKTSMTAYNCTF
ncbi:MAG TPA: hypothetical protein VJU86_18215 [Pyrinomonadaceae bacterium]|nr:hypothetical protein [Pyrinomonadaceae bacterium]